MTGLIVLSLMPLLSAATIVDVLRTPPASVRVLSRNAWAFIACVPVFGPLLWFTLARPYGSGRGLPPEARLGSDPRTAGPRAAGPRGAGTRSSRVRAPDDDAEFLRLIKARVEREKRRGEGAAPPDGATPS